MNAAISTEARINYLKTQQSDWFTLTHSTQGFTMSHPVDTPKADCQPDGSILLRTGAGNWHFYPIDTLSAADVARSYLAACIQAVGQAEAVEAARLEQAAEAKLNEATS